MYHCNACYYFVNLPDELKEIVRNAKPMEKFQYRFIESDVLDGELLSQADVIFLCAQENIKEEAAKAVKGKKAFAEVILCTGNDAVFEEDLTDIFDIWHFPMKREEMLFRFRNLQKIYKQQAEYWLAKSYLDTLINGIPDLVWFKTKDGIHVKVNESFCKAVDKKMEDVEGKDHCYIWNIDPEEFAKGVDVCKESEDAVMEKGETCTFEEDVKIGNEVRNLITYKSPLYDIDGSVMGTVGLGRDVTQEKIYERMILDNANKDFLTGLYNRRYLYQFMEEEKESPLAFYYIDLDNFKSVNDTYGHQAGDEALLITRDVLEKRVLNALISRIGGDEFLIVEKGEVTKEQLGMHRDNLRRFLNEAFQGHEKLRRISASVGTAYSPEGEATDIDRLIEQADGLMYEEKMSKRKGIMSR